MTTTDNYPTIATAVAAILHTNIINKNSIIPFAAAAAAAALYMITNK